MANHGVADHQGALRRHGQSGKFKRTAVDHQAVVLLRQAGDKLVHDPAAGADEFIFRALAELREFKQVHFYAGNPCQGKAGGHLQRRR